MDDRIKEFCERLEFERKWLTSAGHLSSDIDIAFSAIRSKFLELFDKQEERTDKWISVKDRLPKEYDDILVCDIDNNVHEVFMTKTHHFLDRTGDKVKSVTAWMPLPAPYERSDDNEID